MGLNFELSSQSNLTQKLVPLLSKIRTKEPGVMVRRYRSCTLITPLNANPDGNPICSRGYGIQS